MCNQYDQWKRILNGVAIVNATFSTVELVAHRIDHSAMIQPKVQIPFFVAGGVFATVFAVDAIVALARNGKHDIRTTWKDKTSIERLCIYIVTPSSLLGLVLYVLGVAGKAGGSEGEGWKYLLVAGWTVGCVGHILGMLGGFVQGRRRGYEERRRGAAIEMA
jgi:hypothetical protein